MKFESLLPLARRQPLMETAMLRAFGGDSSAFSVQLSRWVQSGKLVQLRRGLYVLPQNFGGSEIPAAQVANYLIRPSYVSLEYALALAGLIPETVHVVQSVTTKRPAAFDTVLGHFRYHYVKPTWFFGYDERDVPGGRAFVARPEKALLDLFHLSPGEWTVARIDELRLQNLETLDAALLLGLAAQTRSPRVIRGAKRLHAMIVDEQATGGDEP